jgi:caffeoyl-CoA O-methyltransferase
MEMSRERWERIESYSAEVFGRQDEAMERLCDDARAAGLPDIAVSAEVGRLLMILTALTRGRLVIEVGTLGGYSATWMARGLAPEGRLITIEPEPRHADFAEAHFRRAGLGERVSVRRGRGLEVLTLLLRELGPGCADVVFLDAVKAEYPDYWTHARPLIRPGGLLLADNVYGGGEWCIDCGDHTTRRAVDRFNRAVASDPDFATVALPIRQGVLVARRTR